MDNNKEILTFLNKHQFEVDVTCCICFENVPVDVVTIGLFSCDCTVIVHELCMFNYCFKVPVVTCPICRKDCAALICERKKGCSIYVSKELTPSGDDGPTDAVVPAQQPSANMPVIFETPGDSEESSVEPEPAREPSPEMPSDDSDESYSESSPSDSDNSSESSWTSHESNVSSTKALVTGKRKR